LSHYVSLTSETKLKAVLDQELITSHVFQLLDMQDGQFQAGTIGSACVALLRDNKLDDLRRLYLLLTRVPSTLDTLRECLGEYTRQSGLHIIQQLTATSSSAERETSSSMSLAMQFVNQVIELQAKLDTIINNSFKADKKAQQKQQDAFDFFINYNESSSISSKAASNYASTMISTNGFCAASYLAIYMDEMLKNSNRGSSADLNIDAQIDQAMTIFRHIADKDLFEFYYKQYLAKRLLQAKSASDDTERLVVARLKSECGYQYTSKLEGMFKDMQMSRAFMDEYRNSIQSASKPIMDEDDVMVESNGGVDLDVQILTAGYWPLQTIPPCRLPGPLQTASDDFLAHYLRKNSGKKLTWLLHLGSVDVKANFSSGRRELSVSTYQACILLCFNMKASWSLAELQAQCEMPDIEFRRHLLSLCTPKLRILRKSSTVKVRLPLYMKMSKLSLMSLTG
jgi:cullin 3